MRSRLIFFLILPLLVACTPPTPAKTVLSHLTLLYVHERSLVRLSWPEGSAHHIPLPIPPTCPPWALHPAPRGDALVIELLCPFGTTVMRMEPQKGEIRPLIEEPGVDAHFLAWEPDGEHLVLKIDTLGNPRLVRLSVKGGRAAPLPLPETTYHVDIAPDGRLLYALTRGLGFGSELYLTDAGIHASRLLLADPEHIIAFARWSPDGEHIAYLLMPDSQVPFTVGELWVMDAQGKNRHRLAEADAGHGFAPAWSPDGSRLAFVVRENPEDPHADQSALALRSNIASVEVESGKRAPITQFTDALVEAPQWSPDGKWLTFTVRENGTMAVWVYDVQHAKAKPLVNGPVCCPVWLEG